MEQQAQELFDGFVSVIEDLISVAGDIAQVEEDKAEAASLKRHELLNGYIQKEQAQILKLRGLEQRRMNLLKELGWESLTFRQILEKASPDRVSRLQPLFFDLENQLGRLTKARQASEHIIGVRLHELQTLIALQEGGSYDNSGSVNPNTPLHSKFRGTYV